MSHLLARTAILTLALTVLSWPCLAQEGAEADETKPAVTQEVANPKGVPEPSLVPRSWDMEITVSILRPMLVPQPDGTFDQYWYLAYKVINNTGQDRQFVPEFTMATDAGDVLESGRGVPPTVFDAIKAKLGNPLLESPNEITGRILQGSDFARESVAIWKHPGHDIDQVRIFASGLSGETVRIANPATKDTVVLRKTYMITFDIPGTPDTIAHATVIPGPTRWVMR